MTQDKPIALWAVPRSLSSVFERSFIERGDFQVFHEPFSMSYYYGEDRQSDRYTTKGDPASNYANALRIVLQPYGRRVFFKDMAYYVKHLLSAEFLAQFVNTFIIRDPMYALMSLYKIMPDFTLEETGYLHLYRAFKFAQEIGQDPVVIDGNVFSQDSQGVMAQYCERLGIPFRIDALTWEPGVPEEWLNWSWEGWTKEAEQSTVVRRQEPCGIVLPAEVQPAYAHCLPYYQELAAYAISPTNAFEQGSPNRLGRSEA